MSTPRACPDVEQRLRHRRAADDREPERAQVGLGEPRLLRHEEVVRGHAHHRRHPLALDQRRARAPGRSRARARPSPPSTRRGSTARSSRRSGTAAAPAAPRRRAGCRWRGRTRGSSRSSSRASAARPSASRSCPRCRSGAAGRRPRRAGRSERCSSRPTVERRPHARRARARPRRAPGARPRSEKNAGSASSSWYATSAGASRHEIGWQDRARLGAGEHSADVLAGVAGQRRDAVAVARGRARARRSARRARRRSAATAVSSIATGPA